MWYRLFKLADASDKGRISYDELEALVRVRAGFELPRLNRTWTAQVRFKLEKLLE